MADESSASSTYAELEAALEGTPYLPPDEPAEVETFRQALVASEELSSELAKVKLKATARVPRLLGGTDRFFLALIVAESNRIEGKPWSHDEVRAILDERQVELDELDVVAFVSSIVSDPKLVETVGLAKAYTLSETFASTPEHPFSASDLRSLHGIICAGEPHAGQYKKKDNKIAGRDDHVTVPISEAGRAVAELCSWLRVGSGHRVLDAAVAHTWLAHLHAFEDGNGRLSRIVANMTLTTHGYPPLILRSDSDRQEYMAALERSDDGDLSSLFLLFAKVLKRYVRHLGDPRTLQRLVTTGIRGSEAKLNPWQVSVDDFLAALDARLRDRHGWRAKTVGRTTPEAFSALAELDYAGNHWLAKAFDDRGQESGLIWVGHQSPRLREAFQRFPYPSLFLSAPAFGPRGEPFISTAKLDGPNEDVLEISIRPHAQSDVVLRLRSGRVVEVSMNDAVSNVAETVFNLPVVLDPRLGE